MYDTNIKCSTWGTGQHSRRGIRGSSKVILLGHKDGEVCAEKVERMMKK